MIAAIAFSALVTCAGVAVLSALGQARGSIRVGLAPAAGLALIAVVSTWSGLWLPPPLPGVLVAASAFTGLVVVTREGGAWFRATRGFARAEPVAAVVLFSALLVPIVTMAAAFGGVQAPLSPHDGAFHVQTAHDFRIGRSTLSWYPPGLAGTFGAVLQLAPWLDSAAGAFDFGMGLTLLAPVTIFGLGAATLRNLKAASAAALMAAFTYLFPYYPQIWSGWPQTIGILLVLGLWAAAWGYVDRPDWGFVGLAGLIFGGIVLVHGTELYTSAIVLTVTAVALWQRLRWRRLLWHLVPALLVAMVCAAPYLPRLLHWAGGGGAFEVGLDDGLAMDVGAKSTTAAELLHVFTLDALGIDLPIRLALIAAGVVWALRCRVGRSFIVVAVIFYGLAVASTFLNGVPLVRGLYASTFPWSLPFRLLMIVSVALIMLAGQGWVAVGHGWRVVLARLQSAGARRRLQRAGRLLVVTWVLLATWSTCVFLSIPAERLTGFSSADAAAMTWLQQHADQGVVLANDTFADAGIWSEYKSGVPVLLPRMVTDPNSIGSRKLVLEHIDDIDGTAEVRAAACALRVGYVYYGAKISAWDQRRFPPLAELHASAALQEVFSAGNAVVFRVRVRCVEP